ncbi:MAG: glutamate--tRNA ligase [Bacteroidota bacterium]
MAILVRVRFAPSPTGLLHIGGLRTALYNYLLARQTGGTFVLRIEDTDQTRYVAEAEGDILDSLRWVGLSIDEGPGVGGPHEPYYQSQRSDLYQAYAQQLVDAGHAYYAFDTPDALRALRERGDGNTAYHTATRGQMRNSLSLSEAETADALAREPYVVRLKVPTGETIAFDDAIRGTVSFQSDVLDDQVLLKSDGLPTYHLANVVDDHHMGITHVIRGEEWLPSTPKHIALYNAFGWTPPQMAHLPLILSPTGGKLSKRNADKMGIPVSVRQYREAGYLPEALLNFLAFLGWNDGTERELFTLDELVQAFSLDRVGTTGAQFSMDKLQWYNQQYLMAHTPAELAALARPLVEAEGFSITDEALEHMATMTRERIVFVHDIVTSYRYFFAPPTAYNAKGVKKRWKADTGALLNAFGETMTAAPPETAEAAHDLVHGFVAEREVGLGKIMAPLRLALSGEMGGPDLFEMLVFFGAAETVHRIDLAIERIES